MIRYNTHHRIPRHMGGGDEPSNLVRVTEEQHAELHLALYLEYGDYRDWQASQLLLGMSKMTDEEYAECNKKKAQPGNQHAKGNNHDKDAEWFKRVSQKRSTFRWYYKGDEARFSAECPGEGWLPGRKPGSLAHGNHNHKGENNPRALRWRLNFQDGRVIIVSGLKEWCKTQPDINYQGLYWSWQRNKPYKNIIKEVTKL